jgi:proliferating cell nuclear antigen PCNA
MDSKHFSISSGKSLVIKNLLEVIKPFIKETNLIFDSTGIKISSTDKSGLNYTYIKLNASEFEFYHCPERHIVGIDTILFFKSIKSTTRSDTITFYMDRDNDFFLGIKLSDSSGCKVKDYKLPILDLEEKVFDIDTVPHDISLNMSALQFQQIIKDIHMISGDKVEIQCINKQITFESIDGSANIKISLQETPKEDVQKIYEDKQITFNKFLENNIFQGKYKVSYLMNFTKASHLCETINIYLANDKPLFLEYSIADLGTITFILLENK